ncbi:hypothetical protein E2553_00140 [Paraburkholderia dipogonis]|uniref:Uncharacterized protein n=1 Tax=Paraburkholderia dipogonis TaxID=1211383 RepID=A0A4Y8N1I1_9BURK|nr:hypothetical protein [Paraburkholderia dipogonis]TFE43579.1 hypothetical protein E2553_00140 [Paraburkholderia dipogonis]
MSELPHLSADRWMPAADAPEFTRIRTSAMADLSRASRGIKSIARILHNSIGDGTDEMVSASIDELDKQNLAGAIECLADFIYENIESETFNEAEIERMKREACHE